MSHALTADEKNNKSKSYDTLIPKDQHAGSATSTPNYSTLGYRHRGLGLLAFYVPLLIIPWVLTCVLARHPADQPSYFDQWGFTTNSLRLHVRLINALAVLNSIASIVTIPIVSALLAQAAVVYTQRRRKDQAVSVRQAFALADRGWSNLGILLEAWPPWKEAGRDIPGQEGQRSWHGPGSSFLWLAALFLLICGIQQPIREAVVSTEQTLVMSSSNNLARSQPYGYSLRNLGYDAEPDDLRTIPEDVVVRDIANSLASFTRYESPSYLWSDRESRFPFKLIDETTGRLGPWSRPPSGYFVAALPNGTTTGVLRHRIMRLNSTVECEEIDRTDFPSSCGGESPFTSSLKRDQLQIQICVPGHRGEFPWQISRDKQDISEEVFIDASGSSNGSEAVNLTRHCSVQTTRGYFELGNYRNDYIQGPLLENWVEPDPYVEKGEYNDWLSSLWRDNNTFIEHVSIIDGRWRRPSVEDKITDIPGWPLPNVESTWPATPGSNNSNMTMAGPLMTSIIAMFGDRSPFALASTSTESTAPVALSQICQSGRMPFSAFGDHEQYVSECADSNDDTLPALTSIMAKFVDSIFNDTVTAVRLVSAGVYFANQAMLIQTVQKTESTTGRPIYFAPGQYIPKPSISIAGIVVISILLLIQLIGLAYLSWYIYQVPTWTGMLDALAVARITNSMDRDVIPAIGSMNYNDLQRLRTIDGLVGVVETHADQDVEHGDAVTSGKVVELGLGATGLFNRRLAKFRVQRNSTRSVEMECQCEGCRRRRVGVESSSLASSSY